MKLSYQFYFFLIGILFLNMNLSAQENFDIELKQKLDSILYVDQTLRELYDNSITPERKTEILSEFGYTQEDYDKRFWGIVAKHDSLNLTEIEKVFDAFGYPGTTLVGEPTHTAAWYVIQHSDKIEEYFPIIKKAGEENELPKRLVAMMEDRLLMGQNKEQLYGTQVAGRKIGDSDEWFQFVWPIKNPNKVNELRLNLGFDSTVEENAKRLGVDYKMYTLSQIDSILNSKK